MIKFYNARRYRFSSITLPILIFIFLCNSASAQPGVLDQTFGTQGKVVTQADTNWLNYQSMVLQPDGKIILVAWADGTGILLVRYKTDGSLDSTFGTNGKATGAPITYSMRTEVIPVALQPSGKIIVGGMSVDVHGATQWAVCRFNSNGSFDNSFGVNGVASSTNGSGDNAINSLAIRPDGRIVAGGTLDMGIVTQFTQFALMQFSESGILDSSFGTNGIATFNFGTTDLLKGIALTPTGSIIAAGTSSPKCTNSPCNNFGFLVIKLAATGKLDSTFGTNGIARKVSPTWTYVPNGCFTMQNGNIITAAGLGVTTGGYSNQIARCDSTGVWDNSFGTNGTTTLPANIYISALTAQADGKIIAIGHSSNSFNLARFNSSGSIDSTFGRRGLIITNFPTSAIAEDGVVQQDGKIVLSGTNAGVNNRYNQFALARYEQNARVYYNTFYGTIFYDINRNGIRDSSEPLFRKADVQVMRPGIDTINVQSTGKYLVDVDSGTANYVVTALPYRPYYNSVPAMYTHNFTGSFKQKQADFAMQAIPGKRDVAITIVPLSPLRPGFSGAYRIMYTNLGTDTLATGSIEFIKDNRIIYNGSTTTPGNISGDTISWNISNLMPGDTSSIVLFTTIQAPPLVNINDTLKFKASIYPFTGDLYPSDNVFVLNQTVRGSYDPNDKSESHGGVIKASQIATGEYLQYTIRFQNTGTDTAFNVYIRDTLDSRLDWSTFQMTGTSHNFDLAINEGGKCLWTFNNIILVDSVKNAALSHGYIQFRVKPRPNVNAGDIIKNRAAIYFDYNLPVITNTETTLVTSDILPVKLISFNARKSGKVNLLTWNVSNELELDRYELQRSSTGADFKTINSISGGKSSYTYTDEHPLHGSNYYRLKMLDRDGSFSFSVIRLLAENGTFDVVVYPNPAKERLQVQIAADKKAVLQMQVTDVDGKVVLMRQTVVEAGRSVQTMDISSLQNRTYFLKVIMGENEQMVLKFEKL